WTLAVLITAVTLRRTSDPNQVLEAFGFALITTACGMCARVILSLYVESDDQVVKIADTTPLIRRFTDELEALNGELEVLRTRSRQAVEQWVTSFVTSTGL